MKPKLPTSYTIIILSINQSIRHKNWAGSMILWSASRQPPRRYEAPILTMIPVSATNILPSHDKTWGNFTQVFQCSL